MEEISSAWNFFCSPLKTTEMRGFSPGPDSTLKGQRAISSWTVRSLNLRPMSLLASKTVLVGLRAVWFLAASPMRRSSSVKAT